MATRMGVVLIIIFYAEDYVEAFGGAQARNSKLRAKIFFLAKNFLSVERNCSLKGMSVGSFTIAVKRQGTR